MINTQLQPVVETVFLRPLGYIRGLFNPELARFYHDDIYLRRALGMLIEPHFNCLDIGCHIGSFLACFVRKAPGGTHTAVEPTPEKVEFLRRKFPNIKIHEVALSDTPGQATFYLSDDHSGYNSLNKRARAAHERDIKVSVDTLDNIIPTALINLVKMDVEGEELNVLRGGGKFIERNQPIIIFENGPALIQEYGGIAGDDLFMYFTETLGYDVFSPKNIVMNDSAMTLDEHRRYRTYPFTGFNFVAKPRSFHVLKR